MQDDIIFSVVIQILCLWIVDYYGCHGWGVESLICIVNGIYIMCRPRNKK